MDTLDFQSKSSDPGDNSFWSSIDRSHPIYGDTKNSGSRLPFENSAQYNMIITIIHDPAPDILEMILLRKHIGDVLKQDRRVAPKKALFVKGWRS